MLRIYLFTLVSLILSSQALAQWQLVNEESTLNYVSTKNDKVGEVNSFKNLNGSIASNGNLSVEIDLASVETNVTIRNERMTALLFEATSFSTAKITAALDIQALSAMNIGDTYNDSISFNLSLHGVSTDIVTDVQVVKLSKNSILAVSLKPIIVSADAYKLAEGLEKLRALAGLASISSVVPVTFSLVFSHQ